MKTKSPSRVLAGGPYTIGTVIACPRLLQSQVRCLPIRSTNQITGMSYDAAGNITSDGVHTYTFDAEGNVTEVDGGSTAAYTYDARNLEVRSATSAGAYDYVFDAQRRQTSKWQTTANVGILGRIYSDSSEIAWRGQEGQRGSCKRIT